MVFLAKRHFYFRHIANTTCISYYQNWTPGIQLIECHPDCEYALGTSAFGQIRSFKSWNKM